MKKNYTGRTLVVVVVVVARNVVVVTRYDTPELFFCFVSFFLTNRSFSCTTTTTCILLNTEPYQVHYRARDPWWARGPLAKPAFHAHGPRVQPYVHPDASHFQGHVGIALFWGLGSDAAHTAAGIIIIGCLHKQHASLPWCDFGYDEAIFVDVARDGSSSSKQEG